MSSTTSHVDALSDSASLRASIPVRRKPPPPTIMQRPASASAYLSLPPQHPLQPAAHSFHKTSFCERYPDPDPTDPFAPLWVLRNRTSSTLHRDGPPALGQLIQQRTVDEFGFRQPDRRRSVSYLPTFLAASTLNVAEGVQPTYASDHGHVAAPAINQSIDNGSNNAAKDIGRTGNGIINFTSVGKRQSIKPTPLSQVTVLAPSVSRGSASPIVSTPKSPYFVQRPHTADSSGTESDATRVGHFGSSEVEITPRGAAQPSYRDSCDYQPPQPQPQQQKLGTGPTNKLTRFLKARKLSQSDSNSHHTRASITDISRIRKASISPPVFSTMVWAGHGGDFMSIKDHPIQQNAISVIATTPSFLNSSSPLPPPPVSQHVESKQGTFPIASLADHHVLSSRPIPSSFPKKLLKEVSTPLPTPAPSQISHGCTDGSKSTSSFVHVPTAFSSPSLAQLADATGPGVSASITSSATMKIKRTSSRPISKLPPSITASPLNNSATVTQSALPTHVPIPQVAMGEWDIPTLESLTKAASLPVIAESGVRITFGTLFAQQKVVVLFIRHFWCPLCQDYMTSVASLTRQLGPEAILSPGSGEGNELNEKIDAGDDLEKSGPVKLVVIGNGSYTMIGKYKQIFGSGAIPLDIYTDPSLAVYAALGLGKDPASLLDHPHSRGHTRSKSGSMPQAHLDADMFGGSAGAVARVRGGVRERSKSGGYVKHGVMGGIAMVFVRALKVGMPVWEKGGDLNQIGGEFVFGPGLVCTYAHRMQTTKDHAPFDDVLRAAGILIPIPQSRTLLSTKGREQKHSDEKKTGSLRKSRPSISSTLTQATKSRARGKTIDIVPISTAQPHSIPAMPTSASSPLPSRHSQFENGITVPELKRRKSVRRRSAVRSSTASVLMLSPPSTAPASAGPFVQMKPKDSEMPKAFPIKDSNSTAPACSITTWTREELSTPVAAPPKRNVLIDPSPQVEPNWKEDRYRSLQKIRERKNTRRGLSQADERQVSTISLPLSSSSSRPPSRPASRSRPHSRSLSPAHSLSRPNPLGSASSLALSASQSQIHREMERTRSRRRYKSMGANVMDYNAERAVQSDTSLMTIQKERSARQYQDSNTDEGVIVCGRRVKMNRYNLSREHLARREAMMLVADDIAADTVLDAGVEEDIETLSEKTLVLL